MRNLKLLTLLGLGLLIAPLAHAQDFGVQVNVGPDGYGPAPVCEYGYYDYYPYACAPYGFYGPEWFSGGVFIGAGPWFHGHDRGFDRDRGFEGRDRAFNDRPNFDRGRAFNGREQFRGDANRGNFRGSFNGESGRSNFNGGARANQRADSGRSFNGGGSRQSGGFQGSRGASRSAGGSHGSHGGGRR